MEVRQSGVVVVFSFLVALLTDDEGCEGAVHRGTGHLTHREKSENDTGARTLYTVHT